jgi:tetratricopeptide (TPR) repeat protein
MSAPPTSPRLEQVRKLLEKSPRDPFLLYAIALEYKKLGAFPDALTYLQRTLDADPDYLYAYYQQGQILEAQHQPKLAIPAYDEGIRRARAKGDQKALGELQSARELLD